MGDVPAEVGGEGAEGLVDLVGGDASLFGGAFDVVAGDGLGWVEVGGCSVQVFGNDDAAELGVDGGECNAMLRPLIVGQAWIGGAFFEELSRGIVRPLLGKGLKRGAAGV